LKKAKVGEVAAVVAAPQIDGVDAHADTTEQNQDAAVAAPPSFIFTPEIAQCLKDHGIEPTEDGMKEAKRIGRNIDGILVNHL
jgi:hypothetical protein